MQAKALDVYCSAADSFKKMWNSYCVLGWALVQRPKLKHRTIPRTGHARATAYNTQSNIT